MKTVPCQTCPWRLDATADDIPLYDPAAARALLNSTCGTGDGFRPVMACHGTPAGQEGPCIGYVASRDGCANLTVRLMALDGTIDLSGILDTCDPLNLHNTYAEVLEKLETAA